MNRKQLYSTTLYTRGYTCDAPAHYKVSLEIDLGELAQGMAPRAARNKSKSTMLGKGAIRIKLTPA